MLALGDDRPLPQSDRSAARQLRHAEAEAARIASLWPDTAVTLLLGAAASDVGDEVFGSHDVVHIASHARVSQGIGDRATVRLGAGIPLTARGMARQNLNAELIYLSCCEGDRRLYSGGVTSFARACLKAGARTVIAAGQRIDDAAAAALAERFYRHWLEGRSKAEALRIAQLEMRRESPEWAHPYYWGTYRLMGDPR